MRARKRLALSAAAWLLPTMFIRRNLEPVDFVFVCHPRDVVDIGKRFPSVKYFPETLIVRLFDKLWPIPVCPLEFVLANGSRCVGVMIAVPSTAQMLLADRERAKKKFLSAVQLADRMGAKIVCLGGLSGSLTDGGQFILSKGVKCNVTTGHSFTVATLIETIRKACETRHLRLNEARLAVVGACGSIGAACCRWLLREEKINQLILIDLKEEALAKLKGELAGDQGLTLRISTDLNSLQDADIVVVATNNPNLIIQPDHLRSGSIVIDDAQPPNVSPAGLNTKGILLAWGGCVNVPGVRCPVDLGLFGQDAVFSCLGECLLLCGHGLYENYTIGPVDIIKVKRLLLLASDLGFSLPPLQAFGRVAGGSECAN